MKKTESGKTDPRKTTATRGRPMTERPFGPGSAFAQFVIDELIALDITNNDIADALGYARPNIVSAWKTRSTKFPLENIWKLAELTKVSPAYLLALYVDQYVNDNGGLDHWKDIVRIFTQLPTDDEWEIIQTVREARKNNSLPMTDKQKDGLSKLFAVGADVAPGPYKPVNTLADLKGASAVGGTRRFARRGFARDTSVDEAEEIRSHRASEATPKPEPTVRKRSRAARVPEAV